MEISEFTVLHAAGRVEMFTDFQCKLLHGKCTKSSNTFIFLFSNKTLVIRAGIHKIHHVRIASLEAV